jgi:hypothetical protein
MGALITLFCFLGKSHIHWPINKSFGTLSTPQWEHLFGPQSQNRNKCALLHFTFLVCIHGSWTLGKPRCYWEHLGECIWEYFGNLMGIRGGKKKFLSQLPLKKKKLHPSWEHAEPSQWLHAISLSKTVCHHFLPPLMAGGEFWGQCLWIRKQLAGLYCLISKFPLCSGEHRTVASTIVENTLNTPPPWKQACFSAFFRWSFFAFFAPCMVLCKNVLHSFAWFACFRGWILIVLSYRLYYSTPISTFLKRKWKYQPRT